MAFPVLHGPYGEDGTVQGMLECLDVPYVGAGVLASAVCMDKLVFKRADGAGGAAAGRARGGRRRPLALERDAVLGELGALGLPVFVKPVALGSSVGIGKADHRGGAAPGRSTPRWPTTRGRSWRRRPAGWRWSAP